MTATSFRAKKFALLLLVTAGLSGCAVGPDFAPPAAPDVNGYASEKSPLPDQTVSADGLNGDAQRFVKDMDVPGEWWTVFHSAALNTLIEQALKSNPDLQAAQAALRVANENTEAQRGAYYPNVQAGFSPSRQKTPNSLAPATSSNATIYNLSTAQVSVGYTLDLWGGNRRQVEALQAEADQQKFQLEATYLTLISNVVAGAVQEAALRGQIDATQKIVDFEKESLTIMQRQFALGEVAKADLVAQEAALAQAQQALPPLQKQLAQQRDLLTALCGRFPSEEIAETFTLADLQLPHDLPVSLSSKLVEQRPDIKSVEANLRAASANIGVAVANRLPNIALSADLGSSALALGQLFAPGNGLWSLAGDISQPVFDGGTLLHRERAARAAYDQAAAAYRSTVITAFQNVADTLRALQYDADALQAAVITEHKAAESLDITRKSLKLGSVSYLALLNAQQTEAQAKINLVQAEANRYADTVALFQALGGGWWNRKDVTEEDGGDQKER